MSMRTILHSDANCFYASVEMLLNPSLRGKAVAVCGSEDDRHGIVLAKSEQAKRARVKTGQANWEARQACPGLICVPPHYEQYNKFSILLRNIYLRYTDLVEPYGMDECWLDVTGNDKIHGTGLQIAEDIRQTVKEELGITVSIGVSFTKILAKLETHSIDAELSVCEGDRRFLHVRIILTPRHLKTVVAEVRIFFCLIWLNMRFPFRLYRHLRL